MTRQQRARSGSARTRTIFGRNRRLKKVVKKILEQYGWDLRGLAPPVKDDPFSFIGLEQTVDGSVYRFVDGKNCFDLIRWIEPWRCSRLTTLGMGIWIVCEQPDPPFLRVLSALDPLAWPAEIPGKQLEWPPEPEDRDSCRVRVHMDLALPLEQQWEEARGYLRSIQKEAFTRANYGAVKSSRRMGRTSTSELEFLVFALRFYARYTESLVAALVDVVVPGRKGEGTERIHNTYQRAVAKLREHHLLGAPLPNPRLTSNLPRRRKAASIVRRFLEFHYPHKYKSFLGFHGTELS